MREPTPWDIIFLEMAQSISQRSKDPSTQVGALLVSPDKKRMSSGFNGFPSGYPETPTLWERPTKYKYVCHAEINAILQAGTSLAGWTMYVTIPTCSECAKYVLQSGIKRVVFKRPHKPTSELEYQSARDMLETGGVEVVGPI